MNQFEHDTNGALVDTTPLFASNLMALFYVLRKSYNERRTAPVPTDSSSQTDKE